jgi:hypothetical protein
MQLNFTNPLTQTLKPNRHTLQPVRVPHDDMHVKTESAKIESPFKKSSNPNSSNSPVSDSRPIMDEGIRPGGR